MKIYQKILLGFALFLVLFIAAVHVYVTYYLEDQIKTTLVSEINSNSDGKYELTVLNLDLSFIKREILLEDISFNTTARAIQQLNVDLNSISLSGIDISQLLLNREISIRRILVENPVIQSRRDSSVSTGSSAETLIQRAAEASSAVLTNILIPEITFTQFDLKMFRQNEQTPYLSFSNSELNLFDTSLNKSSLSGSLPFKNVTGEFNNIEYKPANDLYAVRIASADFSSTAQTLGADSLSLTPTLSESDFFKKVGYRTDRMEGSITRFDIEGLDLDALMNRGSLISENIFLGEATLLLFRDKNYPRRENRPDKPLPQQLLKELEIPILVDTVSIENAAITYSEMAENADDRGYVEFTNLNARLLNTTNIDSLVRKNSNWILEASTRVMDKGELDVTFQFPLNEESHTITGRLKEMNATELNKAIEPIAAIRIESGNISSVRFEMRMGVTETVGFVEVIYDDLQLSVLDGETGDKNIRSRITSFLANQFKIKQENRAEDPRMGTILYQRESEKSFFNYWWKSLRDGLKTSIGIDN
jgi:hypothetical protein